MKPSTMKKIESLSFWTLVFTNVACVVICAIGGNIPAMFGWLVAVIWICRWRHSENKLRTTEIDLYVLISFAQKQGLIPEEKTGNGQNTASMQ